MKEDSTFHSIKSIIPFSGKDKKEFRTWTIKNKAIARKQQWLESLQRDYTHDGVAAADLNVPCRTIK
jgi:hypothetical protein